eukprot:Nitzschia sp. Nitz4//scaffold1_size375055//111666//112817//NITZ4_000244-RA/size375055-processed-gene-0.425-mRNA-1//-1//CDS//3329540949//9230//frame0
MSFAPYQVDYTVKNTSKTFGFSKKRISFKFGIANPDALAQGLSGAHCRGSEHEVILIWSLNTGKRQILADGKDVHFSESGQNGWTTDMVFQHQFQLRVPNFSTPVRCHLITQPANRDMPNVHPFDLRLNGISYFSFSKIYQLGTPEMTTRSLKGKGSSRNRPYQMGYANDEDDPHLTHEERQAIAAAKLASIRDMRGDASAQGTASASLPPRDEGNLIDLMDAPAPAPALPNAQPMSQFVSSMTMDTSLVPAQAPTAPPAAAGQSIYSNYSLQSAPSQATPQSSYYSQPPQQSYGQPPAYGQPPQQQQQQQGWANYQQPPTPQGYYGGAQSQPGFASPPPNNMMSPTAQSIASYGSAPSFAQPPQQQPPQQQYQQQYQGFPQY